ncbi:hypothetical protein JYK02_25240 [Corallococcus macrosporus]|uniref:Lipoprotein n=1 Tax=Corallococcus macrosporus TaxID=35 RepID=A0ABS3DHR1_9BACT|nr:hypothetical protein [Corallococcus macrosporus]MBN8230825.1 hypothetical protein [Corallococcus macrosporus]
MMRRFIVGLCGLLLASCSAEINVETAPFTQTVPVTSVLAPVYAEVALDLPEETQDLSVVTVNTVQAMLVVTNPSRVLTLELSARLSFTGQAEPGTPKTYTEANLPPYYAASTLLLAPRAFAPESRTPLVVNSPALKEALGRRRVWLIVENTVKRTNGLPTDGLGLPVNIVLENIVFSANVTKTFPGLGGALEVGGL